VITSEANTAAVVDALGLARDPRFAPPAGDAKSAGAKPGSGQASARDAAIAYLGKNVSAQRIGTTYGIAITFESRDPQKPRASPMPLPSSTRWARWKTSAPARATPPR
jgi:uncharacterized protein involved in exopolysaccharide biosynthesis